MKKIKVSASGKIHLMGEHAVVYGKPALLAAVDKRCFVEITPRKDKVIEIIIKDLHISQKTTEKIILTKTKQAEKIVDKPVDYVILILGKTLNYYDKSFTSGFTLTIKSEIPFGSGMGSSAAAAVSIVAATALFLGEKFDKEKINNIAFSAEHFVHGFPSGGDTSTSSYGGFIWYRKETPDLKIIQPVQIATDISIKDFFIINTGVPKETTGEMVSLVKTFVSKHKKLAEKIFNEQENFTRNFLSAIQNNDAEEIKNCIKNGEKNLEKLGVVSPYVKKIIRTIEKSGGAAKICGGGGKTNSTGFILVYSTNIKMLELIIRENNLILENILLGEEGVKIHE